MAELAVGMVQVLGYPAALNVADVMVKAAQVVLVSCEGIGSGYWTVIVRGTVADVQASVQTARHCGQEVKSFQVIAHPPGNLGAVLPITGGGRGLEDYLL